ncbi:DUF998 domain-containing protein [Phytomonospora sp. NPDC050363]|uniref:DUF998 domain-containing protein n=1 Tax=Phytomonospora sp. NPDC050363 TaxID=3155642 RepID=UPI0033C1E434
MTRRAPLVAAGVLWAVAAAWYLVAEAVAARALSGYGYAADYISDLGIPGSSPAAAVMNLGFAGQGLLFALAGALVFVAAPAWRGRGVFLALAVAHGVGNVLVGLVHSGSREPGVDWHVVGAAMAIVGGNAAVIAGGLVLRPSARPRAFRGASVVLGAAGLVSLLVLTAGSVAGVTLPFGAGAWERGSVYPIIAWELLAALAVLRRQGTEGVR